MCVYIYVTAASKRSGSLSQAPKALPDRKKQQGCWGQSGVSETHVDEVATGRAQWCQDKLKTATLVKDEQKGASCNMLQSSMKLSLGNWYGQSHWVCGMPVLLQLCLPSLWQRLGIKGSEHE